MIPYTGVSAFNASFRSVSLSGSGHRLSFGRRATPSLPSPMLSQDGRNKMSRSSCGQKFQRRLLYCEEKAFVARDARSCPRYAHGVTWVPRQTDRIGLFFQKVRSLFMPDVSGLILPENQLKFEALQARLK